MAFIREHGTDLGAAVGGLLTGLSGAGQVQQRDEQQELRLEAVRQRGAAQRLREMEFEADQQAAAEEAGARQETIDMLASSGLLSKEEAKALPIQALADPDGVDRHLLAKMLESGLQQKAEVERVAGAQAMAQIATARQGTAMGQAALVTSALMEQGFLGADRAEMLFARLLSAFQSGRANTIDELVAEAMGDNEPDQGDPDLDPLLDLLPSGGQQRPQEALAGVGGIGGSAPATTPTQGVRPTQDQTQALTAIALAKGVDAALDKAEAEGITEIPESLIKTWMRLLEEREKPQKPEFADDFLPFNASPTRKGFGG
ncbi:MAG: hypothetical protein B7733_06320 [Myxococcales bacterium FL481]|nr:MAG: hypothetical protein B7733_06320 [Myxococcales bacterium FL481]